MSTGILAGKAVLVTGASRGIGAATARTAHREGATVIAHYGANSAAAKRLAGELGAERTHLVAGDLVDPVCTRRVWDQAIEAAPADLCRCAIGHFRAHGGGAIVNVASRSSHRGDDADHLAYGAAKGGLLALTRGIARGYAGENILAYAVAPSWVATDLSAEVVDAKAAVALPLREPVPPQDVAETIVFLASGRARHATGATVDITGADYVR